MQKYQRIQDLRVDADLKQITVAEMLKTTQKQYSRWETGTYPIPFEKVIQLAQIYNVSIDYIAGLTNDKQIYSTNNKKLEYHTDEREIEIIDGFRKVNEDGKKAILQQVEYITNDNKYKKINTVPKEA